MNSFEIIPIAFLAFAGGFWTSEFMRRKQRKMLEKLRENILEWTLHQAESECCCQEAECEDQP